MNRAAAACVGCVATGALSGAAFAAIEWFFDRSPGDRFGDYAGAIVGFTPFALALGFVPALLIISFSRARYAPWRALPWLVLGASGGFAVSLLLTRVPSLTDVMAFVMPLGILPPIIGAVVAAVFSGNDSSPHS